MNKKQIDVIRSNVEGLILHGEPLSNHTSYKIGGRAEYMLCPESSDGAQWIYEFAKKESIPLTIIGAGSNIIVPDNGIDGIVLKLRNSSAPIVDAGGGRILADAGVILWDLARETARMGLRGLEPVAGIPGTVGGAVYMNAGTKDGDIASLLEKVEVLTSRGRKRVFLKNELSFGYRKSALQGTNWLILRAQFKLKRGNPEQLKKIIEQIQKERQSKFPLEVPSAGSVFKRPRGDYAGRLIEEAGCKGMKVGGASVSRSHANFIINSGGATADDILKLISEVRRQVYDKFGIYLELEQELIDSVK